jgi:hypothetical protein
LRFVKDAQPGAKPIGWRISQLCRAAAEGLALAVVKARKWEIKQLQPPIQAMRGKQAAPVVRVRRQRGVSDLLRA